MKHRMVAPNFRRRLCLAIACSLAGAAAVAQPAPPLPPEFADFDRFVEQQLKLWNAPGVSIAVVKDGRVILARGYGLRDVANKLPMTAETVQPIASTTKSFTVAALATLVRDGKLEWDKPVRDYLPDFRLHADYATNTVTVRDLVTHRSGLPRHDAAWYGSPLTREELFQRLRHFPLSAEPRARFQYNNLMYMTAGLLGGRVAFGAQAPADAWERLVSASLLEPLGMASTSFTIADLEKAPDRGRGYAIDENEKPAPKAYQELTAMGPTGSLNSNARDMARYLQMMAAGGSFEGRTLINRADLRAMTTAQFALSDAQIWPELAAPGYGMGWFVRQYRGHALVEHGGNMPGASTTLAFLPGRNAGVYATVNVSGSSMRDVIMYAALDRLLGLPPVDWGKRLRDQYERNREADIAALKQMLSDGKLVGAAEPPPATAPRRVPHGFALAEYAGEYEHPGYGTLKVELGADARGRPVLKARLNALAAEFPHLHHEVFQSPKDPLVDWDEARLQFLVSFEGDIEGLRAELEPAVKPIEFRRLPDARFKDRAFLATLAGTYRVGVAEWTVTLRPDGVLVLGGRTGAPNELIGVTGTRFAVKDRHGLSVRFLASRAGGPIDQLLLNRSGSPTLATRVAAP
jgi:CubicO group peptidase (beta-lactamase class C family)